MFFIVEITFNEVTIMKNAIDLIYEFKVEHSISK